MSWRRQAAGHAIPSCTPQRPPSTHAHTHITRTRNTHAQGFSGWIIQVVRFIILINGYVPISLYITLELIKVLQCTLMLNQDRQVRGEVYTDWGHND